MIGASYGQTRHTRLSNHDRPWAWAYVGPTPIDGRDLTDIGAASVDSITLVMVFQNLNDVPLHNVLYFFFGSSSIPTSPHIKKKS